MCRMMLYVHSAYDSNDSKKKPVVLFVFPILFDVYDNDLSHVWLESNIVKLQTSTCDMKCSLETVRAKDVA